MLYYDGQFGSSSVDLGSGNEILIPTTGSLTSNLSAPGDGAGNPFDSLSLLGAEGQMFTQLLSVTARSTVNIVFAVDLTGVPETGSDWRVTFAGKTFSGMSLVGIEFSTDGSSYASFGSVALDPNDTPYTVNLDPASSETAFVRFRLGPSGVDQPILDNVAIHTPEPGSAGGPSAS